MVEFCYQLKDMIQRIIENCGCKNRISENDHLPEKIINCCKHKINENYKRNGAYGREDINFEYDFMNDYYEICKKQAVKSDEYVVLSKVKPEYSRKYNDTISSKEEQDEYMRQKKIQRFENEIKETESQKNNTTNDGKAPGRKIKKRDTYKDIEKENKNAGKNLNEVLNDKFEKISEEKTFLKAEVNKSKGSPSANKIHPDRLSDKDDYENFNVTKVN